MERTFTAIVHRESIWYVAECPEVGTACRGSSIEEAIEYLREAAEIFSKKFL